MQVGGAADLSYPTSKIRRGRVQGGGDISPTLTTTSGICKLIAHEDLDKYIERRETATRQEDNLIMGKKTKGWIDYTKNIVNINGKEIDIETLSLPDRAEIIDELPVEGAKVEDYLYKDWGVFKLSPREALRLMAVDDEDIDKMAAVNSATQLYKTAGNSIIVTVLCAIFSQLGIRGKPKWNEMTDDERYALTGKIDKNFGN